MIHCRATGVVYRNPKPHLRAIHTWHPSVVRLDDGELVAAFDLGQAVEALDYRTYLSRSGDSGETWSEPVRLFEDTVDRPTTHTVRISRTADGTLIGLGSRAYRDDPEEGLVNRENLGYTEMDLILLTSRDGGRSWEGPKTIEPPLVGPGFEICHGVRELSDGRWLAPTSNWKGWNGDAPNGMNAIALVSHDRGASWPEVISVMDGVRQGHHPLGAIAGGACRRPAVERGLGGGGKLGQDAADALCDFQRRPALRPAADDRPARARPRRSWRWPTDGFSACTGVTIGRGFGRTSLDSTATSG